MSKAHASDGLHERGRENVQDAHVSSELALELRRLGSHPLHEVARLEREALAGESPATPMILIVGMALALWSFVAVVVGSTDLAVHLLG
jgi:hypothetical protein